MRYSFSNGARKGEKIGDGSSVNRRFRSVPRTFPGLDKNPGDFFFVFPFSQRKPVFGYCPCRKDLTRTQESNLFHYLGSRGLIRRFENLSSTRMYYSSKGRPTLAIVLPKMVFRPLCIRHRFSMLLGSPCKARKKLRCDRVKADTTPT